MQVLSLDQEDPLEEGMAYWSDLACHAQFRKVKQLKSYVMKPSFVQHQIQSISTFHAPLYLVKYYMTKGQVL